MILPAKRRHFTRVYSIPAPVLAADAVMEEEETVGIVFSLDREKASIVLHPRKHPANAAGSNLSPTHRSQARGTSLRISFIAAVTASASLRATELRPAGGRERPDKPAVHRRR